ncbi:unannotated protein [freshwater metagenome]|uniref:Unannotated protein n=1 Tax=freshwater metagenome TaxID=449393 RepID=A0A6J7JKV8_9ZZZZ
MRKTRLRKVLKEKTWMITESASMTKTPPMTRRSSSVLVMIAMPATRPPSPSDPVSPMNTVAGCALYQRNPTQPPTAQAARSDRSLAPVPMKVMPR